ncbi:MAG: 2-isopropylmalate synthase [Nitrososphaerales archaeon]
MAQEEYIRIYDTTLRDGEQTPGVSLTLEQKLIIAQQLDKLGVDVIEAGFPITSKGEVEAVKSIAKAGLRAEVIALARCNKLDIDTALSCDVKSLHLFIATSDIHLKHKLKISREEALERAIECIKYAKGHNVTVEFSAEDATRTNLDFLKEFLKAVVKAGADRLDIPDTVGICTPERMSQIVREVKSVCNVPISVHCHNDFGLAVYNTIAGIKAGANQAHLTVNGIGERAGNASLEEVVMALHCLYGKKTRINTQLIYETSQLVSRLTGIVIQPNKAIVGDNAFGHESGIHTHGVLEYPLTYEPITPELVGRRRWIMAGKHAGSHGIQAQLESLGIKADKEQLKIIVEKVKELGDKGKRVTDADLEAIAKTVIGQNLKEEKPVQLLDLAVMTGIKVVPTASVKLMIEGKEILAAETGVGPVDSAIKAIQKISESFAKIRLKEYRLDAITGGSDALAEVSIKVEDHEGNMAWARAIGEDVVVASVEAMIDGINKLLMKKKIIH